MSISRSRPAARWAWPAGPGRQVDPRARCRRVHPPGRAGQGGRPGRHRGGRRRDRVGRRAARPGRDRLLDAGQPAVGLEAVGPRGAGVRPREPGRAPGRDGRADRRHAGPPVHRPPRRSRAVRLVGWRAAAGGHRQHRGHGHVRPDPRRADRAARSGGHGGRRRPAGGAGPGWDGHPVRGARPERARPDGSLHRPRWRPPGRLGRARRGPGRGGVGRLPARADPRPPGAGGGHRPRRGLRRGGDRGRPRGATRRPGAGRAHRRHGRDGRHGRPRPRRPRTRRPPGRRRAAGHRSASRSRTSSTATRPGSRRSAASRSRSSRARRWRSWARTARARRPS